MREKNSFHDACGSASDADGARHAAGSDGAGGELGVSAAHGKRAVLCHGAEQVDVNVKGVYHCVNAAMPSFLRKHAGCIITVSSMWGQVGASCEAAYSATKGAIIALTKALAQELGPSGVRVNCVSPGVILTDMCASVDPEVLAEMAGETPVGRNGTPMDVAKAMEYLANADFVTGQVLPVNGGYVI